MMMTIYKNIENKEDIGIFMEKSSSFYGICFI